MPVSLKDQVALVVGASSGIGRSTAVMLAREGVKVMASARRKDRLLELKTEMAAGLRLEIFTADATDASQMNQLCEETRRTFGPVNIMIYATGTNTPDRSMRRM